MRVIGCPSFFALQGTSSSKDCDNGERHLKHNITEVLTILDRASTQLCLVSFDKGVTWTWPLVNDLVSGREGR